MGRSKNPRWQGRAGQGKARLEEAASRIQAALQVLHRRRAGAASRVASHPVFPTPSLLTGWPILQRSGDGATGSRSFAPVAEHHGRDDRTGTPDNYPDAHELLHRLTVTHKEHRSVPACPPMTSRPDAALATSPSPPDIDRTAMLPGPWATSASQSSPTASSADGSDGDDGSVSDIFESSLSAILGTLPVAVTSSSSSKPVNHRSAVSDTRMRLYLSDVQGEDERALQSHLLWPAGVRMAEKIERRELDVRGETVLEIGAGAALSSLTASKFGAARIVITDYPAHGIL